MDPVAFSQLMQVLGLIVPAIASVVMVVLQLRMKQRLEDTNAKVDGMHGANLAGKATAFQALAMLDPSPATQAAAKAASAEVKAYHEAKQKPTTP